jgi:hypothetical protein
MTTPPQVYIFGNINYIEKYVTNSCGFRHNIAEILLKVALNTITQTLTLYWGTFCSSSFLKNVTSDLKNLCYYYKKH